MLQVTKQLVQVKVDAPSNIRVPSFLECENVVSVNPNYQTVTVLLSNALVATEMYTWLNLNILW